MRYYLTHGLTRQVIYSTYLEVCADISQLALQEQQDVLVILAFLIWFRVQALGKRLKVTDVLVEAGKVLLDDEGQLVHLNRVIVKERSLLGHCERLSQYPGRAFDWGPNSFLHCASFWSLPIVAEMPLPISAALLANSERRGFPSALFF